MTPRIHRRPVVVITGASNGVGRATAFAFAKEGYDLALMGPELAALEELAGQLRPLDAKALPVKCDVTSSDDVSQLVLAIDEQFGFVNVLVNNASIGLSGPVESASDEALRQLFDVNVFGLARVTRALLPLLRRQSSSQIINVSSVLGHRALPWLGGFSASMAAVNALTESLRLELKPQGVDVLLVSAGLSETDLQKLPLKPMRTEALARAIVSASKNRRRDTLLTLPGLAMAYGNRVSPRLVDLLAARLTGSRKSLEP